MRIKKLMAMAISMMLCLQMLPVASFAASAESEKSISGNSVKVVYNETTHQITLYRTEGTNAIQMSKPANQGYPIVNGQPVQDFIDSACVVQSNITGVMGSGERMTITSQSASTGLTRTYIMETSATVEGAIYTATSYQGGSIAVTPTWFVDNAFALSNPGNVIWSYNGGGEGPTHTGDTLRKIDLTDSQTFTRENIQDYKCAGIPISDIYTAGGGITVGDASATRREVRTPVQETANSVNVSIKWPGKTISPGAAVIAGQSFINVHRGDYYVGLRGYSESMTHLGVNMIDVAAVSAQSYDLRWESWGWEFNWTVDLIIGELDRLQAAGVKQITLDDGWYDHAGDWALNPSKFPNGAADIIRLTDAIHAHGMTALLWWRPCDGGQGNSRLYQQHPEYFVKNQDGSTGKLDGAGQSGNFFYETGYALCPTTAGALATTTSFINRAMNEWGFDGFKGDFVWSMPKCYDASHNHAYPEESTEKQAEIYRVAREAMVANDPASFNLLCNCGNPEDYYSLPYVTQVATADPTSLDQTRTRAKAYKALMGDYFPVTTDHNSVWYPTTVGTGSVMIEKRAFTGANWSEYVRWLGIANTVQLHKGRFIGDLYSYGFDPYETYVVEKDGVMHYAFYRDGSKYSPTGYPEIQLKGLDPAKMYRIVDYVNDRVVATNLMGNNAVFTNQFSSYLLVKAVEITTPDPEPADPDAGFQSVDDRDPALTYVGTWNNDSNSAFYEGTARYTNAVNASVEFTFTGTAVRWYGQNDTNFGTADVYLDGSFVKTVNVNGSPTVGKILFEALNLSNTEHTIKVVRKTQTIDIDRFAYRVATPEQTFTKVDALSNLITYSGVWTEDHNQAFDNGNAKYTAAANAYAEMTFQGTAVRWYGQHDTNFGSASVYLDGALVETVNVNGTAASGLLLFERTGLSAGTHTIRIICNTPVIDIDYLAYAN